MSFLFANKLRNARFIHSIKHLQNSRRTIYMCTSKKMITNKRTSNEENALVFHHRFFATKVTQELGFFTRTIEKFGFTGKLGYNKSLLKRSAIQLYLCCLGTIQYEEFFKEFELEDTFNSWFRITELHIWMLLVRLAQEGREGKYVRNEMVKSMWKDLEERVKKLGSGIKKSVIGEVAAQFHGALFGYDEGILDDDYVLAGALWRHFFEYRDHVDPGQMELLVQYTRRQMAHIDSQDTSVLLQSGFLTLVPLDPAKDVDIKKSVRMHKAVTI